jgi:DNA primase
VSDDPVTLTRQVKEASDIVAVVGSYLTLHPAGGVYKAICPFHNDTRPSLQVDPKWQNFRCWACGKKGDVFTFVAEFEKITFREARELLARRAGINLEGSPAENVRRGKLLDAMKWAEKAYEQCLLDSDLGERARIYLAERKLAGPIVRAFGLGYAAAAGDWLVRAANTANLDMSLLKEVGLVADRKEGSGFYDRFRDRVMFPIRDARGQTVGFGGRILPDSPFADRGPKYYNSSETPLFQKKELLYGLDAARHAGATEGYLAVVEGYTDVMMAHQHGVKHVVATMGTALNEAHVRQLRRFVPRVVLVFDADAGGVTGVDRAVELFVTCDVDLDIATLPEGLDPCDLLASQGAEAFRHGLDSRVNAIEFKVRQLLAASDGSVGARQRAVDEVLGVLARAPEMPGESGQVRIQLVVTQLVHRFGLDERTVRKRLAELRANRRKEPTRTPPDRPGSQPVAEAPRARPARAVEKELLQILLAEPGLVEQAYVDVRPEEIEHPGLQQLLGVLYRLHEANEPPTIDGLRDLVENSALIEWAIDQQEVGRSVPDRETWFGDVLERFRAERVSLRRKQLMDRLRAATDDGDRQRLLREIQDLDRRPGELPGRSP